MRVRGREIERGGEPFVIAEIGVNHDGSVERALELVDGAAWAGADAVKVQMFRAAALVSGASGLAGYQRERGERDPRAMLERLELDAAALRAVRERAHRAGVAAIATVFSEELVGEAERIGFDAYKTASPDIVNRPLLDALWATGRPLIASTGAAETAEVERAVGWLGGGEGRLCLMQCVSAYPTPVEAAALGGISALERATGLPVGYSDHTGALDAGALAVAAGACALEKHLTWSVRAAGPDHAASQEPEGLREYVRLARRARSMVGAREKRLVDIEADVRRESRQSVVAARAMRAGEVVGREDLTIKRPGTGIEPWRLGEVIGRRLARDVEADRPLVDGDLA